MKELMLFFIHERHEPARTAREYEPVLRHLNPKPIKTLRAIKYFLGLREIEEQKVRGISSFFQLKGAA
jgi:hypothetical protein